MADRGVRPTNNPGSVARIDELFPAARNAGFKKACKTSQIFRFYSPSATPTRNLRFPHNLGPPPPPARPSAIPTTPRRARKTKGATHLSLLATDYWLLTTGN